MYRLPDDHDADCERSASVRFLRNVEALRVAARVWNTQEGAATDEDADTAGLMTRTGGRRPVSPVPLGKNEPRNTDGMPASELAGLVQELTEQMHGAAAELQFEVAARHRDEISDLKKELRGMVEATR